MAKKLDLKNPMVILILVVLAIFIFSKGGIFKGAVAPTSEIIRTISPSIILPNSIVTITYTATDVSGKWGGIISETVPSGYSNPTLTSGLDIKITGNLVEIPFTQTSLPTWTMDAPAYGSTTLVGEFVFSEGGPSGVTTGDSALDICISDCSAASSICNGVTFDDGCGGTCTGTELPVCTRPADLCTESIDVSNGCLLAVGGSEGNCDGSWTVDQAHDADIDCYQGVSNQELLNYITRWVDSPPDTVSNQDLLDAITAWVSS